VGHSLGALLSLLYARTYPRETRGVVFVDGLSPAVPRTLGPRLWPLYRTALNPPPSKQPIPTLGLPKAERVNIDESIAQVERAPQLPTMPVAVITKTEPFRIPPSLLPPGLTLQALDDGYNTAQDYFVKLATTTPHILATGSEHYVQLSQPDLVIATTELIIRRATFHRPRP
jgi:pimeloyl-ACP methyl ester carboxylesterase